MRHTLHQEEYCRQNVEIEVDGDALLPGFASGNPKTEEHFFDKVRSTYQRRAQAILRVPKVPGKTTVSLKAEGLAAALTKIEFV